MLWVLNLPLSIFASHTSGFLMSHQTLGQTQWCHQGTLDIFPTEDPLRRCLWNVAGALVKPNGITRNWNKPFLAVKAVFGLSFSIIPNDRTVERPFPELSGAELHILELCWTMDQNHHLGSEGYNRTCPSLGCMDGAACGIHPVRQAAPQDFPLVLASYVCQAHMSNHIVQGMMASAVCSHNVREGPLVVCGTCPAMHMGMTWVPWCMSHMDAAYERDIYVHWACHIVDPPAHSWRTHYSSRVCHPPGHAAKLAPYPYSADISLGDCTCPIWTEWSKGLDALSHWFIGLASGHPPTLSGETAQESNWFWISGCLPGPSAPWLGDASSTSASRFLLTGAPQYAFCADKSHLPCLVHVQGSPHRVNHHFCSIHHTKRV